MELYKLNEESSYQPVDIIEGYKSLVWTERYRPAGDFQLVFEDINKYLPLFPLGTLLAIRDSREIMIVETREIVTTPNKSRVLTVSGRSFEAFYENRTTLIAPEPINDSSNEANEISIDNRTSSYATLLTLNRAKSSLVDATNAIPFVTHADITTKTLKAKDRIIARSDTYAAVLKLLAEDDLGIKNNRPLGNQKNNTICIYNGTDLSSSVIFSVAQGHFDTANYLWSNKGYKTAVYSSSNRYFTRTNRAGTSAYTGLDRRVALLDNTDITKAGTKYSNATRTRGRSFLGKNRLTTVFSGTVSVDIPYKYFQHYNLGDLVMCMGEFGLNQKLMVSEYIRTEDATGEKAYPTLSTIGEDTDD